MEEPIIIILVIQEENSHVKVWPRNFFEQTYGSLKKYNIVRPDQDGIEQREILQ